MMREATDLTRNGPVMEPCSVSTSDWPRVNRVSIDRGHEGPVTNRATIANDLSNSIDGRLEPNF